MPSFDCTAFVYELFSIKIEGLEDPNQRIRDIVQKRILEFNKQIISGGFKQGMQVCFDLFAQFRLSNNLN